MKRIENDNYIKHFIYEYKKSMNLENESLKEKLSAILEHAVSISSKREEFFELLSYGNFSLTNSDGNADIEVIKEAMNLEKIRIRAYKKTSELFDEPPVVKDTNPYTIHDKEEVCELIRTEVNNLSDEEKKVITELFYNDSYVNALVTEMKKSEEYILTLRKNAIAQMYMKVNDFLKGDEKKEEPAKETVKTKKLTK